MHKPNQVQWSTLCSTFFFQREILNVLTLDPPVLYFSQKFSYFLSPNNLKCHFFCAVPYLVTKMILTKCIIWMYNDYNWVGEEQNGWNAARTGSRRKIWTGLERSTEHRTFVYGKCPISLWTQFLFSPDLVMVFESLSMFDLWLHAVNILKTFLLSSAFQNVAYVSTSWCCNNSEGAGLVQ